MLILSNALTNVVDEGCVKVATSLVKRIKKADKNTFVIAFERSSDLADEYMTVNKLLLNCKLISKIKLNKGNVMYIPFPAKMLSIAIRTFILSIFSGKNFKVLLCMTSEMGFFSKLFFKLSGAEFVVFSKRSYELYCDILGERKITYLKTGVDTEKYVPVSSDMAQALKIKYGFNPSKKLVLHVGHLNNGRNVQQLMKLSNEYSILLISSTQTKNEQDIKLKNELLSSGVRIIDSYIPNIEQIYQMADVYFFPVLEQGRCIDVPLSCMEAAACNKPIVTTEFGEMREFIGKAGFYFIESFDKEALLLRIQQALEEPMIYSRRAIIDYDWSSAIEFLMRNKKD